jgi:hypothetical protein
MPVIPAAITVVGVLGLPALKGDRLPPVGPSRKHEPSRNAARAIPSPDISMITIIIDVKTLTAVVVTDRGLGHGAVNRSRHMPNGPSRRPRSPLDVALAAARTIVSISTIVVINGLPPASGVG